MPCGRTFIMRVVAGNIFFDVAQMLAEPFISIGMVGCHAGAEHIHEGKTLVTYGRDDQIYQAAALG